MRHWWCSQGLLSGSGLSWSVADGVEPSAGVQQQCQDLVVWWSDLVKVCAAVVAEVEVDTCICMLVGEGADIGQGVVVVYYYSPEVVLCVHLHLSVMPGAAVTVPSFVYLGVLTSSFSVFWVNLASVFADFACWNLLCCSVWSLPICSWGSPGYKCTTSWCMLLALTVLARDLLFFAVALCVIVLSTPEAHERCICVVGYLISHAFSVSMLRLDSIVGYCVTIQGQIQ